MSVLGVDWTWLVYAASVALRLLYCPWLDGYIHPDEFFQGGQELWFGCPPSLPWEYRPEHALRSVLVPFLLTRLPLTAYAAATGTSLDRLSGDEVLVVPRVWCALVSLVSVDGSLWALQPSFPREGGRVPAPLLLCSTLWTTCVLLSRPFSNTLEACVLALLLAAVQRPRTVPNAVRVGALCALGVFVRFTFVCFALPSGVRFLRTCLPRGGLRTSVVPAAVAAASFSVLSVAFVCADTRFYRSGDDGPSPVVTPWNAFLYNSQPSNLRHHGLHPRWTHAVVGMLLLFGPLALAVYASVLSTALSRRNATETGRTDGPCADPNAATVRLCSWTVASGLALLSLAPHQEPRFLLPLVAPVAVVAGTFRIDAFRASLLLVFNLALFLLFGRLHQAGLTDMLRTLSDRARHAAQPPSTVVFFRTYMPPTFLMRSPRADATCRQPRTHPHVRVCPNVAHSCPDVSVLDLQASTVRHLTDTIRRVCLHEPYLHIVTSPMSDVDFAAERCGLDGCEPVLHVGPHLSTEDLPPLSEPLSSAFTLNLYRIDCRQFSTDRH